MSDLNVVLHRLTIRKKILKYANIRHSAFRETRSFEEFPPGLDTEPKEGILSRFNYQNDKKTIRIPCVEVINDLF